MITIKKKIFCRRAEIVAFCFWLCCTISISAQISNFNALWQHGILSQISGDNGPIIHNIQFDHSGNLVTVGSIYHGAITVDGTAQIESQPNYSMPFILKQDPQGNILWSRQLIESGICIVSTFTFDSDNNIYICGQTGGLVDFDPSDGEAIYGHFFLSQWFVLKLSASGEILGFYGGLSGGRAIQYILEDDGYLYVAGRYQHSADIDPGPDENIIHCADPNSYDNLFVLKMSLDGDVIWAHADTTGHTTIIENIAIGPQNEVVLSGRYGHNFDPDFSSGTVILPTSTGMETNFFSATYSSDGDFLNVVYGENLWTIEGLVDPSEIFDAGIDSEGNLYLLGELYGPLDLDPTTNQYIIGDESSLTDIFLLKYSPDRNLIWAHCFGTNDYDYMYAMHLDENGNIYMAGHKHIGNMQIDNQGAVLVNNNDEGTGLLLKFNPDGTFEDVKTFGQNGDAVVRDMAWTDDGRMALAIVYGSSFNPEMNGFEVLGEPIGVWDNVNVCFDTQVGINETTSPAFSIFPNPNNGHFTILNDFCSSQLNVRISNLHGQVVCDKNTSGRNVDIDTHLESGIYLVQCNSGNEVSVGRIVVTE